MTGYAFVMYLIALGGLGLLIGSFLNVVAYRVPLGMSIVHPRSACPGCDTPIAAYDNIPIVSWLLLRGKCRTCKTPISDRYPLVEAMTALTWLAVGVWAWQPGRLDATGVAPMINPLLIALLPMIALGVALWLIDLDHLRLPDVLVAPMYPIAIIGLAATGFITGQWNIGTALLSMLAWFLFFGLIWFGTGGRGMGFGDVKLAPVLGLILGWLGWGPSLIGLFAGFAVGAVYGITLLARSKAGRRTKVPYGPFLMSGALIGLLFGPAIWDAYVNVTGIG